MARLQETYAWLIVPTQRDPTGLIDHQAHCINGQETFYGRAARKVRQNEWLIYRWSLDNLRIELHRCLRRGQPLKSHDVEG